MPQPPDQRQQYQHHLAHLRASHTQSTILLHKIIITLAAGAIALSLTLLDDITALTSSTARWELITAWFFLTITIFTVLLSHWSSIDSHRKAIEHTHEKIAGQNITAHPPDNADSKTGLATLVAIVTLAIGLALLLIFFAMKF